MTLHFKACITALRHRTRVIFIISFLILQSCDPSDPSPDNAAPGNINTIAGVAGKFDFKGDGRQAIASNLGYLTGITLDTQGNILFVGSSGFSGDGGPAPMAELASPQALAVDQEHNVFITDSGNSVIRVVTQ